MRFAVAKQQGLGEEQVAMIDDRHADSALPDRQKVALAFADVFLRADGAPSVELRERLAGEFGDDEVAELAIGLALFHGVSKLLITLGCEPEQMDVTELRTPGT